MTTKIEDIERLFRGSATPRGGSVPGGSPFTTRPELTGTFGMVASTHWLGTAAGMALLEKGGNAFDAAIATALTLQVVEPHMAGPAGDAPIILCDGKTGQVSVICGQGVAPGSATVGAYRDLGLDIVPGARACCRWSSRVRSTPSCCCCAIGERCGSGTSSNRQ